MSPSELVELIFVGESYKLLNAETSLGGSQSPNLETLAAAAQTLDCLLPGGPATPRTPRLSSVELGAWR
jgi:hypothetical protein